MASQEEDNKLECISNVNKEQERYYLTVYKKYDSILNDKSENFENKVTSLIEVWSSISDLNLSQFDIRYVIQIIDWAKLHALNIVLTGEWRSIKESFRNDLLDSIEKAQSSLVTVNDAFSSRCQKLADVVKKPWEDPVLVNLIQEKDAEIGSKEVEFFCVETAYLVSVRLKKLCENHCEDLALNLVTNFLKYKKLATVKNFNLNATETQLWFIFDIYIALLYKFHDKAKILEQFEELQIEEGVLLIKRFAKKRVKISKIWRNCQKIAIFGSRFFMSRALMKYTDEYKDFVTELLKTYLGLSTTEALLQEFVLSVRNITNVADAAGLCVMCDVIHREAADKARVFAIEMYIRALTTDMNELERLKHVNEEDKVKSTTARLSKTFTNLADLLDDHVKVARECVLTAFSLEPTKDRLKRIVELAKRSGFPVLDTGQEWKCRLHPPVLPSDDLAWVCPECGEWMCKPELTAPLQMNMALHEALQESVLGISEALCDDLVVCLSNPRYQILSWLLAWCDLYRLCILYLNDPEKTKNFVTELKFVDVDYSMFEHIKREPVDEYTGIEKGYEQYLDLDFVSDEETSSVSEDSMSHDKSLGLGSDGSGEPPLPLAQTKSDPVTLKNLRMFRPNLKRKKDDSDASSTDKKIITEEVQVSASACLTSSLGSYLSSTQYNAQSEHSTTNPATNRICHTPNILKTSRLSSVFLSQDAGVTTQGSTSNLSQLSASSNASAFEYSSTYAANSFEVPKQPVVNHSRSKIDQVNSRIQTSFNSRVSPVCYPAKTSEAKKLMNISLSASTIHQPENSVFNTTNLSSASSTSYVSNIIKSTLSYGVPKVTMTGSTYATAIPSETITSSHNFGSLGVTKHGLYSAPKQAFSATNLTAQKNTSPQSSFPNLSMASQSNITLQGGLPSHSSISPKENFKQAAVVPDLDALLSEIDANKFETDSKNGVAATLLQLGGQVAKNQKQSIQVSQPNLNQIQMKLPQEMSLPSGTTNGCETRPRNSTKPDDVNLLGVISGQTIEPPHKQQKLTHSSHITDKINLPGNITFKVMDLQVKLPKMNLDNQILRPTGLILDKTEKTPIMQQSKEPIIPSTSPLEPTTPLKTQCPPEKSPVPVLQLTPQVVLKPEHSTLLQDNLPSHTEVPAMQVHHETKAAAEPDSLILTCPKEQFSMPQEVLIHQETATTPPSTQSLQIPAPQLKILLNREHCQIPRHLESVLIVPPAKVRTIMSQAMLQQHKKNQAILKDLVSDIRKVNISLVKNQVIPATNISRSLLKAGDNRPYKISTQCTDKQPISQKKCPATCTRADSLKTTIPITMDCDKDKKVQIDNQKTDLEMTEVEDVAFSTAGINNNRCVSQVSFKKTDKKVASIKAEISTFNKEYQMATKTNSKQKFEEKKVSNTQNINDSIIIVNSDSASDSIRLENKTNNEKLRGNIEHTPHNSNNDEDLITSSGKKNCKIVVNKKMDCDNEEANIVQNKIKIIKCASSRSKRGIKAGKKKFQPEKAVTVKIQDEVKKKNKASNVSKGKQKNKEMCPKQDDTNPDTIFFRNAAKNVSCYRQHLESSLAENGYKTTSSEANNDAEEDNDAEFMLNAARKVSFYRQYLESGWAEHENEKKLQSGRSQTATCSSKQKSKQDTQLLNNTTNRVSYLQYLESSLEQNENTKLKKNVGTRHKRNVSKKPKKEAAVRAKKSKTKIAENTAAVEDPEEYDEAHLWQAWHNQEGKYSNEHDADQDAHFFFNATKRVNSYLQYLEASWEENENMKSKNNVETSKLKGNATTSESAVREGESEIQIAEGIDMVEDTQESDESVDVDTVSTVNKMKKLKSPSRRNQNATSSNQNDANQDTNTEIDMSWYSQFLDKHIDADTEKNENITINRGRDRICRQRSVNFHSNKRNETAVHPNDSVIHSVENNDFQERSKSVDIDAVPTVGEIKENMLQSMRNQEVIKSKMFGQTKFPNGSCKEDVNIKIGTNEPSQYVKYLHDYCGGPQKTVKTSVNADSSSTKNRRSFQKKAGESRSPSPSKSHSNSIQDIIEATRSDTQNDNRLFTDSSIDNYFDLNKENISSESEIDSTEELDNEDDAASNGINFPFSRFEKPVRSIGKSNNHNIKKYSNTHRRKHENVPCFKVDQEKNCGSKSSNSKSKPKFQPKKLSILLQRLPHSVTMPYQRAALINSLALLQKRLTDTIRANAGVPICVLYNKQEKPVSPLLDLNVRNQVKKRRSKKQKHTIKDTKKTGDIAKKKQNFPKDGSNNEKSYVSSKKPNKEKQANFDAESNASSFTEGEKNAKSMLKNIPGLNDFLEVRPLNTEHVVNVVQVPGSRSSTVTNQNTQTSTQVTPHIQRIGQPKQTEQQKSDRLEEKPEQSTSASAATSRDSIKPTPQNPALINLFGGQIKPGQKCSGTSRQTPFINILSQQILKQPGKPTTNTNKPCSHQNKQEQPAVATVPLCDKTATVKVEPEENVEVQASKAINANVKIVTSTTQACGAAATATPSTQGGTILQFICKSSSLPKFQQAFGKAVYQTNSSNEGVTETVGASTSENLSQTAVVDTKKIATKAVPVNLQPITGNVIFRGQVPVGQTVSLIPPGSNTRQLFRITGSTHEQISLVKETVIQNKMSALLAAALQGKPKITEQNGELVEEYSATRITLCRPGTVPPNATRIVKPVQLQIPANVIRAPQPNLSSTTLEQLREFDMVYKQVKERSSNPAQSETIAQSSQESPQQQRISFTYVNQVQKYTQLSPVVVVSSYSPLQQTVSPTLAVTSQAGAGTCLTQVNTVAVPKVAVKTSKGKNIKSSATKAAPAAVPTIPKPQQKPQEDEHTTQRIFDILAEYAEQLRNSPDLNNKPAPRRRSNPPTNPSSSTSGSSNSKKKKKKSSSSTTSNLVETDNEDLTMGSEDSSGGNLVQLSMTDEEQSQSASITPPETNLEPATANTPIPRPLIVTDNSHQPRNVIIADSSVGDVLKMPNTALIMPGSYIMPVSVVKGGQQIAVVSGGSKILTTVPARSGQNMLLFQSFVNQNKKGGISTVKYSTIQPFSGISSQNITGVSPQPPVVLPSNSVATVALGQPITLKKLDDNERGTNTELLLTISQPREAIKVEQSSDTPQPDSSTNLSSDAIEVKIEEGSQSDSSSNEVFNNIQKTSSVATSVIASVVKKGQEERPDNSTANTSAVKVEEPCKQVERIGSVLVNASTSNGPMLSHTNTRYRKPPENVESTTAPTKEFNHNVAKAPPPGTKIFKNNAVYYTIRTKKAVGKKIDSEMQKQAAMEREIRLQKSLSEECEDLGVDEPSTSDLFPEADLLFDSNHSPSYDHTGQKIQIQIAGVKAKASMNLFSDDENSGPMRNDIFDYVEYHPAEAGDQMNGNSASNESASSCDDTTLLPNCGTMSEVTLNSPISPEYTDNTHALNKYKYKYTNRKKGEKVIRQTENWSEVMEVTSTGDTMEVTKDEDTPIAIQEETVIDESMTELETDKLSQEKELALKCPVHGSTDTRGSRKNLKKTCSCFNGSKSPTPSNVKRRVSSPKCQMATPSKKPLLSKKR